jgi:SAM-dependent methyltransferase
MRDCGGPSHATHAHRHDSAPDSGTVARSGATAVAVLAGTDRVTAWSKANRYSSVRRLAERWLLTPSTVRTTRKQRCSGRSRTLPASECSTSAPERAVDRHVGRGGRRRRRGRARPSDACRAERCAARCACPVGSAESIPLPDGSVDAVLAGHALHWFDMAVAGAEISRVLMPGGILAGLWNVVDDRVDWVAGLERVGGSAAMGARDLLSSWRAATARAHLPSNGQVSPFGSAERAEFPREQRPTADSLVAKIATHAGLLIMPEHEREATLGRIRDFLASRPETARGEFTLPMLTGVLRVRRL